MKTIHKAIGFCGLLLIVAMGGCTAAIPWVWAVEFRPHLMNVDKYLCEEQQK
jgi:hypothetical protein